MKKRVLEDDFDVLLHKVQSGKKFFEVIRSDPVGGLMFSDMERDIVAIQKSYCNASDTPQKRRKSKKDILEGNIGMIEFDNIRYSQD